MRRQRPGVFVRRDKEQQHPQKAGISVVANDVTVTIMLSNVLMFSPVVIGLVDTCFPVIFANCHLGHSTGCVPVQPNFALC